MVGPNQDKIGLKYLCDSCSIDQLKANFTIDTMLGESLMKVMAEDEALQQVWPWDSKTLHSQYDLLYKQWQQMARASMDEVAK